MFGHGFLRRLLLCLFYYYIFWFMKLHKMIMKLNKNDDKIILLVFLFHESTLHGGFLLVWIVIDLYEMLFELAHFIGITWGISNLLSVRIERTRLMIL